MLPSLDLLTMYRQDTPGSPMDYSNLVDHHERRIRLKNKNHHYHKKSSPKVTTRQIYIGQSAMYLLLSLASAPMNKELEKSSK